MFGSSFGFSRVFVLSTREGGSRLTETLKAKRVQRKERSQPGAGLCHRLAKGGLRAIQGGLMV
jgi:hypothetical protein